jgi:hypothetical protein
MPDDGVTGDLLSNPAAETDRCIVVDRDRYTSLSRPESMKDSAERLLVLLASTCLSKLSAVFGQPN